MNNEYEINKRGLIDNIRNLLEDSHEFKAARPMLLALILEISQNAYQLEQDSDCYYWQELARLIGLYLEPGHEGEMLAVLEKLEGGTGRE